MQKINSKIMTKFMIRNLQKRNFLIYTSNFHPPGFYESDVFGVSRSDIVYEYEIKISRADFRADSKKKNKHNILQGYKSPFHNRETRPNYFYYVVPTGLVVLEEVPKYAGLIYLKIREGWYYPEAVIMKKAPKLHSIKADTLLIKRVAHHLSNKVLFNLYDELYK